MKNLHLIREVFERPWLIDAVTHGNISRIVGQRVGFLPTESREPGMDACGGEVEVDEMRIENGIAYIPVGGVLARKVGAMERGSGVVDYLDIQEELRIAEDDDTVVAIVLDIDTPGGTVAGVMETADAIAAMQKPVVAYTSGAIASAGFWLASQCDQIVATRGAEVGSIGVFRVFVDISEYYAKLGAKVQMFSSGEHKGAGFPGTSLTPKQQLQAQDEVEKLLGEFKATIREKRPQVQDAVMDGRMFRAMEALEHGLIDNVVTSLDDAAEIARSLA